MRESMFFEKFSTALSGGGDVLLPWLVDPAAPGLDVYRNTIVCGVVDALAATFTTIVTMVGEEWFRAAARSYAQDHPPCEPSLLAYGGSFPDWLSAFPPAMDTPYLGAVARLDRMWWDTSFAADAPLLDPASLAALREEDLARMRLVLHPAVRLASTDENIASLWAAHQAPNEPPTQFAIEERAEYLLLTRPFLSVDPLLINAGSFTFFRMCAAGGSLVKAAEAALKADAAAAFPDIVSLGLKAGAFSRVESIAQED